MEFSYNMVDAVMAKYQGLDRKQLVDCADAIKAKLGDEKAEEVGDEKILAKAASTLQARMRKAEKEKAAAEELKAMDAEDKAVESAVETAVVPAGDYVPEHVMQTKDYVQKIAVINPETDFYYKKANPKSREKNKHVLNKRGLDKVAVAMGIHTELKEILTPKDRIIVSVRGWIGTRDNPVVETEDAADYVFEDKHNDIVFGMIEDEELKFEDLTMSEDGKLWLKDDAKAAVIRNIKIRKAVLRERDFAFRVTLSKARERVIRTLAGISDIDDEEAKMLKDEYLKVAEARA